MHNSCSWGNKMCPCTLLRHRCAAASSILHLTCGNGSVIQVLMCTIRRFNIVHMWSCQRLLLLKKHTEVVYLGLIEPELGVDCLHLCRGHGRSHDRYRPSERATIVPNAKCLDWMQWGEWVCKCLWMLAAGLSCELSTGVLVNCDPASATNKWLQFIHYSLISERNLHTFPTGNDIPIPHWTDTSTSTPTTHIAPRVSRHSEGDPFEPDSLCGGFLVSEANKRLLLLLIA